MKVFLNNFDLEILTILTVLSNTTKDPVHLELFRPFASEVIVLTYKDFFSRKLAKDDNYMCSLKAGPLEGLKIWGCQY